MHYPRAPQGALGRLYCVSLAAILSVGCSKGGDDGKAAVLGKVTYNGQAVDGATVGFIGDAAATPGAAGTATDGAYSLRVKPGNYTVIVSKVDTPASTQPVSMEEAMANPAKPPEAPKDLLPLKYKNQAESPLKFEVKPSGANTFDISLSD